MAGSEARPDRPPEPWTGRDDGPGPEHARWHHVVAAASAPGVGPAHPRAVLIGFACDEGVRRNRGRPGAADGPAAIRAALAPLAAPGVAVADAGDIAVIDRDLEAGQARLGALVGGVLAGGGLPVVLGGGHEVAFGSYLGWASGSRAGRWGVLNIDAHFDLREFDAPTSGTPFLQIAGAERAAGREFRYGVIGINRASNTRALFDTARRLGVPYLEDDACDPDAARRFAADLLAGIDRVHLTLDLDALPAAVAPGVSAPAGFGIGLDAVRAAILTVARSGKLGVLEIAELNAGFDVDGRTARTAARLIDEAVRSALT